MTQWIEEAPPRKRGRSGAKYWLNMLGVLGAAGLLFSRGPGHLLHPELWAEDGAVWLSGAYTDGLHCLMIPRGGYLQTLSVLGGLLAACLPLTAAPLIFAVIAFVVQLAPVALLLSARGEALVPSWTARLLLALYYIGMPNSNEVFVNLTNAMWHLAIVVFMLVVLRKPRSVAGLIAEMLVLVLGGLSGPLVLFIAPIAWWQVVLRRGADGRKPVLYAVVLSLCGVVQAAVLVTHSGTNRMGYLGASFGRLVHILADQIILGGVIGAGYVDRLLAQDFWAQNWPAALCCAVAAVMGLAAFVKGPMAYRQFVVLAVLLMASALKSPIVSETAAQWHEMQYPTIGDRYYILPMLAWFATLLVLAGGRWRFGLQWAARGLVLCCVVGMVVDWCYVPYVHTGYHDAAKKFDRAAPGTTVLFPENPVPWQFALTKD
jgi:hypothetical protein